jgi:hypothetical protein
LYKECCFDVNAALGQADQDHPRSFLMPLRNFEGMGGKGRWWRGGKGGGRGRKKKETLVMCCQSPTTNHGQMRIVIFLG